MLRNLILGVAAAVALFAQAPDSQAARQQVLVNQYCIACHNEKVKTGSVSLELVRTADVASGAHVWEKVLRKVRTGEMPPLGLPRPNAASAASFVNWLEGELDTAALAAPRPGTPAIHRLNRAEYSNAVRDLLGLDLDHSASLPGDDSGYGFDNIGDVLTVSPLLMEKYMSTARRISRLAVGTVKAKPAVERLNAVPAAMVDTGQLPLNLRGGVLIQRYFPVDAEYAITVRLRGNPSPNLPLAKLDVRLDGMRVKLFDVTINTAEEAQHTRNFEIRLPVSAGTHKIGAGFLNEYTKTVLGPVTRDQFGPPPASDPTVDYILIGGPFDPKGPGETESRKRIFVCRPQSAAGETPCAKRILGSLARQAYRRPVTAADVDPLLRFFAAGRQDGGSFDSGIETALRAILVSPSFLFRIERNPAGAAPGSVHRISDLELASRLSFFLWSSLPDEELLRLAAQHKLRPNLEQQVRRMLADSKSKALVDNFAGQWLQLRNIPAWRPDPDKYKQFDEPLRYAMQRETELFFEHIVRDDRPVLEFLDAPYSFLNERLARHYGIQGVRGSYFRQVPLAGEERGGILTQASILTITSYPTRTSPVLRGKWILENVLGSPPPPPPPNVPSLTENSAASAKDLRQALEKHRANAACASCHARLDPLGFSLENFDGIGKFRTSEGGGAVDASASLPGGVNFTGPGGLKKVLFERRNQFVECLSEKLLTYALGRGLEHYDMPNVRHIRRDVENADYRFSSLALAVVNSVPFQMRRVPEK